MVTPSAYDSPHFIAIEGPIGVGKTTLANVLAERLGAVRVYDVEDNPFLEEFYKDKPGAAFQAQFYFLIRRYRQLRDLDLAANLQRVLVSDYIFEKDKIFAYLNLNDIELQVYDQYYGMLAEQVPIPDLVIYLQAKLETLKETHCQEASAVRGPDLRRVPSRRWRKPTSTFSFITSPATCW